jgi:hypothetical protein
MPKKLYLLNHFNLWSRDQWTGPAKPALFVYLPFFLRIRFLNHAAPHAEILALAYQLLILQRSQRSLDPDCGLATAPFGFG